MSIRVEIQPEAQEQIAALDLWWRTHRSAAPSLVLDELERVFGLLAEAPEIGRPYTHGGLRHIRCLRLRRTPYMLYYHYEPGGEVATIVSAWSAMRELSPPIKSR